MDDELKQFLTALEARLEGKIDASEERLKAYVDQRSEKIETKLLSSFHGWSRSMEIRVRSTSATVAAFDERLAVAEERISKLERHKAS